MTKDTETKATYDFPQDVIDIITERAHDIYEISERPRSEARNDHHKNRYAHHVTGMLGEFAAAKFFGATPPDITTWTPKETVGNLAKPDLRTDDHDLHVKTWNRGGGSTKSWLIGRRDRAYLMPTERDLYVLCCRSADASEACVFATITQPAMIYLMSLPENESIEGKQALYARDLVHAYLEGETGITLYDYDAEDADFSDPTFLKRLKKRDDAAEYRRLYG